MKKSPDKQKVTHSILYLDENKEECITHITCRIKDTRKELEKLQEDMLKNGHEIILSPIV